MGKLFFVFALFLLYTSCAMDYTNFSEIVNNSAFAINISIKYNKQTLEKTYENKRRRYISYLTTLNEASNLPFKFDTVNLKVEYVLPAEKRLMVDRNVGGWGVSPDYLFIEEIKMKVNKKLFIYNRASFDTAFKKSKVGGWELVVQ